MNTIHIPSIEVDQASSMGQQSLLQDAIFTSANFSSIATDAQGVIQIFNVGAERMLGYKAEDVVDKITPAGISDPQEVIARAEALSVELSITISPGFDALVFKASRGIEDIYELTYIRKDGSRFPAIVSVTALRDDQDAIIGYLLIGTDNTARKQAEEALRKAGALQNAIFNSANFSSIATDAKGVIQIFNVGAERMLGYTAAEVMNKITPADISDPKEVIVRAKALSIELLTTITPGFEALVFKASRGIEDIYELTYIRKDGSRFPAIVSVTALRDDQDAIIGYLLIGTDNTARKQVEAEQTKLDQRLRDQQFYTRSLIESNIDALMTTDPRGIISDVNKQMEALTGCTRDELIGAPFKNYFTDPERAEEGIMLVLQQGKVTNYELTAQARDGTKTVVSYNATTFHDRDRKLQGVFAAARDVTDRKQFELMLQENNLELESAKAAAEKANFAKSDFLSSMSHELRTPLNAILGYAQLMDSEINPAPSLRQKKSIGHVLQAGWYLLSLIDEILDLATVESGKITLSMESVSLTQIMRDCWQIIEPQALNRGIELTFPAPDNQFYIHGDWTRTKQVLINLLSNAVKYNHRQGKVNVQCTKIGEDRVRVTVTDTGAGLSVEHVAQLFQPFNRLGQETSSEQGTGIGLVVTKKLVELMDGTIGVESVMGVGSTFWFELATSTAPYLKLDRVVAPGTCELAKVSAGSTEYRQTMLYVEDNTANLELVKDLIERRTDLKLLTAADGNIGIQLALAFKPDVILMDINLPGINGFEILKLLRADPATAHIPVVALSANAVPRDVVRGIEAGFFRYLTKPLKVPEFMDALDSALSSGKVELKKLKVDLAAILAMVVETSAPSMELSGHIFRLEAPSEPIPLFADTTRIIQVVSSVINNAAKYTPKGGVITLSAAREGDEVLISIRDNGIGIAESQIDGIFTMFAQVGQSIDRSQEGFGIGLSLVRQLVGLHGGSVSARSLGLSAGSVFTIRLPLALSDHDGSLIPGAAAEPSDQTRLRILIADDNVDSAEAMSELMSMLGHDCRVAYDGAQALAMAGTICPNVIFLDIGMPILNGYETAMAVRQMDGMEGVVLIALTGWGGSDERAKSTAAGFDHHIIKPASLETLSAILKSIVTAKKPGHGTR